MMSCIDLSVPVNNLRRKEYIVSICKCREKSPLLEKETMGFFGKKKKGGLPRYTDPSGEAMTGEATRVDLGVLSPDEDGRISIDLRRILSNVQLPTIPANPILMSSRMDIIVCSGLDHLMVIDRELEKAARMTLDKSILDDLSELTVSINQLYERELEMFAHDRGHRTDHIIAAANKVLEGIDPLEEEQSGCAKMEAMIEGAKKLTDEIADKAWDMVDRYPDQLIETF